MDKQVKDAIKGKIILITGGTGSFGNTVIRSLLSQKPSRIIIFSRDEKKQFDMRNVFDDPTLRFVIGDVRDGDSVASAMHGVDYVFHAAALKQVPTCEFFPIEAVKTNVLGAYNVLEAAIAKRVKRVVILSTDKAVYPINAMGMSKALMEKTMMAASRRLNEEGNTTTTVCGVRYGNVLYSRGSVLPYFVSLIARRKALTVTNPAMTRFLLPLSEAVDLVLFALVEGESGHMYVRKAPACTIETLAKAVCRIFRYEKGHKEVGVRAGEKIHETLVTAEEMARAKELERYYDIPPESQGLEYNKYFYSADGKDKLRRGSYTSENTKRLSVGETVNLLMTLPEIKEELQHS